MGVGVADALEVGTELPGDVWADPHPAALARTKPAAIRRTGVSMSCAPSEAKNRSENPFARATS